MAVPGKDAPPSSGKIVVGVDDSEGSLQAVDWAAGEANLRHVPLVLVHVHFWPGERKGEFDPELEREADILRVACDRARRVSPDVVIEQRTFAPTVMHALVKESVGAQMLVIGSTRLGPIEEYLFGSVAHTCMRHASCPVVVVRG